MSDKTGTNRDLPTILSDKNTRTKRKVYKKRSSLYQNVLSSSSSSSYGKYSAKEKLTPRSLKRRRKLRFSGTPNKFLSQSTPSLVPKVTGKSLKDVYSSKTAETNSKTSNNASKSSETLYTYSNGTKSKSETVYTSTVNTDLKQPNSTDITNKLLGKMAQRERMGSLALHTNRVKARSETDLLTKSKFGQKSKRPEDFSKNCLPNWAASSIQLFDGTKPMFEPEWKGAKRNLSDSETSSESFPNCMATSTTGLEQYYKEYKKNKFRTNLPPGIESNESLNKLRISKAGKDAVGRRASDMLMEVKRTKETRENVENIMPPLLRHTGRSHTGVSEPKSRKITNFSGIDEGNVISPESQPDIRAGETEVPVVKHPSDSAVVGPSNMVRRARKAAGKFRGNMKLLGSSSEHKNAGRVEFQPKRKPIDIKQNYEEAVRPLDAPDTLGGHQFMTSVGRGVPVEDHIVLVGKLHNDDGTYKKAVILGKLHQRSKPDKRDTNDAQLFGSGDSALSLPHFMVDKPPLEQLPKPGAYGEGQNIVKTSQPEQFAQHRIRRMSLKVGGKIKRLATNFRQNLAKKRKLSEQELFSMHNMAPLEVDSAMEVQGSILSSDEKSFEFSRFKTNQDQVVIGRKRKVRTPQGGARGNFLMRIPSERENPFSEDRKLAEKLKLLRIDMLHDINENLKKWRRGEVEFPVKKPQIAPKDDFTFNQLLNRNATNQEMGNMKDGMRLLRRPSRASSLGLSSTGSWYSSYLHNCRSVKTVRSTNSSFYRKLSDVVQGWVKIGATERAKKSVAPEVSDHIYDEVPSSDDMEIFKNGSPAQVRFYDPIPIKSNNSGANEKFKRLKDEEPSPKPIYDLLPSLSDNSEAFRLHQTSDKKKSMLKEKYGFMPGKTDKLDTKSQNPKVTNSSTKQAYDFGLRWTEPLSITSLSQNEDTNMRKNTPLSPKRSTHTPNEHIYSLLNIGDVIRSAPMSDDVTDNASKPDNLTGSLTFPSDVPSDITPSTYDSNDLTHSAYGSGDVTRSDYDSGDVTSALSEHISGAPPPSAGFIPKRVKKGPKSLVHIGRRGRENRLAADVASGDRTPRNVTFSLPLAADCMEGKKSSANRSAPERHSESSSNLHRVLNRLSQAAIGRNSEYWLTKGQSRSLPIYDREISTERRLGMRKSLSLESQNGTQSRHTIRSHKNIQRNVSLKPSGSRSQVVIGRRFRRSQNTSAVPWIRTGPQPASSLSASTRRSSENSYGYDEVASEGESVTDSDTATGTTVVKSGDTGTSNQVSLWSGTDPSSASETSATMSGTNAGSNVTNRSSNYSSSLTAITEDQSEAIYDVPPNLNIKSDIATENNRIQKEGKSEKATPRSGNVPTNLRKNREVPGFPGSISLSRSQPTENITSLTSKTSTEDASKLMKFFDAQQHIIPSTSSELPSKLKSVKLLSNIHGQNPTTDKSKVSRNSSQSLPSIVSSELDVFGDKVRTKHTKFPKGLLKLGAMDFSSTNVSQLTTWFDRSTVTELSSEKSSQSSDETDQQLLGNKVAQDRLQRKKELEEKATIMYLRGDGIVLRSFQCRDREVVGNQPALAKGKHAIGKNEIPMSLKYTQASTKRKACTDVDCLDIKCTKDGHRHCKGMDVVYDPEGTNEVTLKDVKDLMKTRNLNVYDPVIGPPGAKPLCQECPIRTKRFTPFFPDHYADRTLKPLASRVVDFACYEGKNLYVRHFTKHNEEEVDNYCEQFSLKALVLGISRYMTEEAIDTSLLDVKTEELYEGFLTTEIGVTAVEFGARTYSDQCIKDARRLRIIENYIANSTKKSVKPPPAPEEPTAPESNAQQASCPDKSAGKYKKIESCKIPAPPSSISTAEGIDDYLDSFDEDDFPTVKYTSLPTKLAALKKVKTKGAGKLQDAAESARIASGAKIKSLNHLIEMLNNEAQSLQKMLPVSRGFEAEFDEDVAFIVYKMVCQVSISDELVGKDLATGLNRKRLIPTKASVHRFVKSGLKQNESVTTVVSSGTQTSGSRKSLSISSTVSYKRSSLKSSSSSSEAQEDEVRDAASSSGEESSSMGETLEEELAQTPSTSRRAPDTNINQKSNVSKIRKMFGARRRRQSESKEFSSSSMMFPKRKLPKTIKRFFHKLLKQGVKTRRRKSVTFDDDYLEHWKSSTSSLSSSDRSSDYYVMKLEKRTSPSASSETDSSCDEPGPSKGYPPSSSTVHSPRKSKRYSPSSPHPSAGVINSKPTEETHRLPESQSSMVFGSVPESLVEKFGNIARNRPSNQGSVEITDEQPGRAFFETPEPTGPNPSAGIGSTSDESDYVVLRVVPSSSSRNCESQGTALDLLSINYESDMETSVPSVSDATSNQCITTDSQHTESFASNCPVSSEENQSADTYKDNDVALVPSVGPSGSKQASRPHENKTQLPEIELVDKSIDASCDSQSQMSLRRYCIVGKDWEQRQQESMTKSSCNDKNITIGMRERKVENSSIDRNSVADSVGKRIGAKLSCRGEFKTRPSADVDATTSAYLYVQDHESTEKQSFGVSHTSSYDRRAMSPVKDKEVFRSLTIKDKVNQNTCGGKHSEGTMKVFWKLSDSSITKSETVEDPKATCGYSDIDTENESSGKSGDEDDANEEQETLDGVKDLVDELNTELQRVVSWAEDAGFDTSNILPMPKQQDSSERFCAEISSSLAEIQTSLAQFEKMVSDFKPPGEARENVADTGSTEIQLKLLEAVNLLRTEVFSSKTQDSIGDKKTPERNTVSKYPVSSRGVYSSENYPRVPAVSKRFKELAAEKESRRWRRHVDTDTDTGSSCHSRNHHCCRSRNFRNACCGSKLCKSVNPYKRYKRYHPYPQQRKHQFKVKFASSMDESELTLTETEDSCQEFVEEPDVVTKQHSKKYKLSKNGKRGLAPRPSLGPNGFKTFRKRPVPQPRSSFNRTKRSLDASAESKTESLNKIDSEPSSTADESCVNGKEDTNLTHIYDVPCCSPRTEKIPRPKQITKTNEELAMDEDHRLPLFSPRPPPTGKHLENSRPQVNTGTQHIVRDRGEIIVSPRTVKLESAHERTRQENESIQLTVPVLRDYFEDITCEVNQSTVGGGNTQIMEVKTSPDRTSLNEAETTFNHIYAVPSTNHKTVKTRALEKSCPTPSSKFEKPKTKIFVERGNLPESSSDYVEIPRRDQTRENAGPRLAEFLTSQVDDGNSENEMQRIDFPPQEPDFDQKYPIDTMITVGRRRHGFSTYDFIDQIPSHVEPEAVQEIGVRSRRKNVQKLEPMHHEPGIRPKVNKDVYSRPLGRFENTDSRFRHQNQSGSRRHRLRQERKSLDDSAILARRERFQAKKARNMTCPPSHLRQHDVAFNKRFPEAPVVSKPKWRNAKTPDIRLQFAEKPTIEERHHRNHINKRLSDEGSGGDSQTVVNFLTGMPLNNARQGYRNEETWNDHKDTILTPASRCSTPYLKINQGRGYHDNAKKDDCPFINGCCACSHHLENIHHRQEEKEERNSSHSLFQFPVTGVLSQMWGKIKHSPSTASAVTSSSSTSLASSTSRMAAHAVTSLADIAARLVAVVAVLYFVVGEDIFRLDGQPPT